MIRQTSQRIRPPERPVTPFGEKLRAALERAQAERQPETGRT